ncbi:MAG TPA: TlpA disulfide reductase family protein [Paucimonas sp.]|nr:TlpA disulfide reductase family protein [Paucimonas sp.]
MSHYYPQASELQVSEWINAAEAPSLAGLSGRVVVIHVFQMLCPACVSHGLPQAALIHANFPREKVAVLGLHSVFEHHDAMTPAALRAFVAEYRLRFPIGIDRSNPNGGIPLTMHAYGLRGTPSLILLDKAGRIRLQHFGHLEDLIVGAAIGQLIAEDLPAELAKPAREAENRDGCGPQGCQPA